MRLASDTKRIFVVGLDDFNRKKLDGLTPNGAYAVRPLLTVDEVVARRGYPVEERLAKAERVVERTRGGAAAIVGYWDFPVSLMASVLRERFALPGPSLESVLRCEHKYWSRLEQRAVVPAHVPDFVAVDPFDDASVAAIPLRFPFWIKPVKSYSSHLGFRIRDRRDLERAIAGIREGIGEVGEAFEAFLTRADLPDDVAGVRGMHCIAEAIVAGRQCTLEGWVHRGRVEFYGAVDSIRFPNRSTFRRYEYPSALPPPVLARMRKAARAVVRRVGLDDTAFNVEFLWDARRDRVWLLEINPRISQSHGDLFQMVDGTPNHAVMVQLALGRRPVWRSGAGPHRTAAKFFMRRFSDARVVRAPSADDVARLEREMPGAHIDIPVREGMLLSEVDSQDQDSYSYVYGRCHLGGSSREDLMRRYRRVVESLPFEFAPVEGEEGAVGIAEPATEGPAGIVEPATEGPVGVAAPTDEAPTRTAAPTDEARPKHVFLVGLNEFYRAKLERVSAASDCVFHTLLDEPNDYDLPKYLEEADRTLRAHDGPIDAVVGYMDFPVSTMLPILCERFGLRSPSLESVLRCEHKYWSRVTQKEVVPEHVPAFAAVDPFDDESVAAIPLRFPFWIKPVKSAASYLGFRVGDRKDLARAIHAIRAGIGPIAEPFDYVLDCADLPPEIRGVDGRHCLVEELISGRECTLEGWVSGGKMGYHGIVDSVRAPNRSSFMRYEYPSLLPGRVQRRMVDIGRRILEHAGYDDAGFNMELEWDRRRDRIRVVEINTRVAQHHSDLFEKVDGVTNHEVPIQIGLGRVPRIPHREGEFRRAATFFLRRFQDAEVVRVPEPEEVRAIEERIPGTVIQIEVRPGMRLSELFEQDSYSYALALIYIGARDQRELLERYRSCVADLHFELAP